MTVEKNEQEFLEGNLLKALTEAEMKTGKALESVATKTAESEKHVWAAAEAAEYASLVYALTHEFEDANVTTRKIDAQEIVAVVKEASQSLERVLTQSRQQDRDSLFEGYRLLRQTADALRMAYLAMTKTKSRPWVAK